MVGAELPPAIASERTVAAEVSRDIAARAPEPGSPEESR
jgi:hypothetical protein